MTTTEPDIQAQEFRDSLTAGLTSIKLLEAIQGADSWHPEALNQHLHAHPALGDELTDEQMIQALLHTLHAVLEAAERSNVREDIEAALDD